MKTLTAAAESLGNCMIHLDSSIQLAKNRKLFQQSWLDGTAFGNLAKLFKVAWVISRVFGLVTSFQLPLRLFSESKLRSMKPRLFIQIVLMFSNKNERGMRSLQILFRINGE